MGSSFLFCHLLMIAQLNCMLALCFYKIKDVEEFYFCLGYRKLERMLLTTLTTKKCHDFELLGHLMSQHNQVS